MLLHFSPLFSIYVTCTFDLWYNYTMQLIECGLHSPSSTPMLIVLQSTNGKLQRVLHDTWYYMSGYVDHSNKVTWHTNLKFSTKSNIWCTRNIAFASHIVLL